jgi:cytochrome c556
MTRNKLVRAVTLLTICVPTIAMTGDSITLKEIMQGLRNDLVEISDGLLTDDFTKVENGARSIAEHPQIAPEQVKLVAAALGPEMATFKQLDNVVHDLSLEISAAAKNLDRDAVVISYQRMIEGCLNCHHTYKEHVAAVLL